MSEFGEVISVTLPRTRDTGKPRGYSFVQMSSPEEMKAAVEGVKGRLVGGRVLAANEALPKDKQPKKEGMTSGMAKVYVGNISYESTEQDLVDHFSKYGTVFEVFMPTNGQGEKRGYGFVTIKDDEVESVLEQADGTELDGRTIAVKKPLAPGEKAPRRKSKPQRTKIYVGNLSFYTSQDTLGEVFSEFGDVYDCYIPSDPATGSSRGFGFVAMEPEDAQRAIAELDSCELDGRIIRVNEAQPKGKRRPNQESNEDNKSEEEGWAVE